MTRRLGCMNGCPLDHHEPPCPKAEPLWRPEPEPPRRATPAEIDRAYNDGFRAAAKQYYELGIQAGYAKALHDLNQDKEVN